MSDHANQPPSAVLGRLFKVIAARRGGDPAASYTAALFAKGVAGITDKVTEEAGETVEAALSGTGAELTAESADLIYHLLVLWVEKGLTPDDIWAELERREGVSGIAEKDSRGQ